MTNKSKNLGTLWETEIVNYLNNTYWPHAERRTLSGVNDKGDIDLHPQVVVEAKNHGTLKLAQWLVEAEKERLNAGADVGVVWAKRRGKASAGDGYVVMSGEQFVGLLARAGLGGLA